VSGPPPVPPHKPRSRRCIGINSQVIIKAAAGATSPFAVPNQDERGLKTRRTALISTLTALYIAANAIPISAFIGGAGFITAGIILLPVIARLLRPKEAVVVAIFAPLVLFTLQLSIIPVFGFYGMLIPALGIIFGSLGFHKSYVYPTAYVAFGAFWYIIFSNGTPLWLAPYFVVIAMAIADQVRPFKVSKRADVLLHSFDATMCELVTMNIGSISLLRLPGDLWTIITPFMFFERTVAVIGASSILLAVMRIKSILKLEYI